LICDSLNFLLDAENKSENKSEKSIGNILFILIKNKKEIIKKLIEKDPKITSTNYSDKSFFSLIKTHLENTNGVSEDLINSIEEQYNEEKSEKIKKINKSRVQKIKEITNIKFEMILSSENIEMI
jgi:hypothetical protein